MIVEDNYLHDAVHRVAEGREEEVIHEHPGKQLVDARPLAGGVGEEREPGFTFLASGPSLETAWWKTSIFSWSRSVIINSSLCSGLQAPFLGQEMFSFLPSLPQHLISPELSSRPVAPLPLLTVSQGNFSRISSLSNFYHYVTMPLLSQC